MKKVGHITVIAWLLTLCLCLSACDIGSLMEGLGLPGPEDPMEEATAPATRPTQPTQPPETTAPTQAPTEATEPESNRFWVCAVGGLNIRSGPGRDYTSLGNLPDGSVVEPLLWENGWAYIQEPTAGWCSGDYLHPLGWYHDVKMPVGEAPADGRLAGKWIHLTQPTAQSGSQRARVGILELSKDGTFRHTVAEYAIKGGKWQLISNPQDQPQWVGEYQYDGTTLTLNYMAFVELTYAPNGGQLQSRQFLPARYILETALTLSSDNLRFTIPNGELIPCFTGFGTSHATLNTLFRADNSRSFPEDVCAALDRWFP